MTSIYDRTSVDLATGGEAVGWNDDLRPYRNAILATLLAAPDRAFDSSAGDPVARLRRTVGALDYGLSRLHFDTAVRILIRVEVLAATPNLERATMLRVVRNFDNGQLAAIRRCYRADGELPR